MTRVEAMKARLEAATPGPWRIEYDSYPGCEPGKENRLIVDAHGDDIYIYHADQDLAVHAPQDLRDLLALYVAAEAVAGNFPQDIQPDDPRLRYLTVQVDVEDAVALRKVLSRLESPLGEAEG